jgi:hypothetical protein
MFLRSEQRRPEKSTFLFVNSISLRSPHPTSTTHQSTENLLTFSTAIAREYGEGVTGKAVSTYFERARKEHHWNLANTVEENGSASKSTPRKRQQKATPKKQAVVKNGFGEEDEDDDVSSFETPSKKKTPLNKVKNGRVQKTSGRSRSGPTTYAEPPDSEDEDEQDGNVKIEHMDNVGDEYEVHHGNGYENGNGHNYDEDMGSSGYANEMEDDGDKYYDA